MTGEPTLFDAPATRGSSRRSDPATSREAGRSVADEVLRDQQALVLHVLDVFSQQQVHAITAAGHDRWVLYDRARRAA